MYRTDQRKPGWRNFLQDATGETPIENALVMLIVAAVSLLALMVVMVK